MSKRQRHRKKSKSESKKQKVNDTNASYISAKPDVIIRLQDTKKDIKVRDIQSLITYLLADGINPHTWVNIKCKSLISKVVVLLLDSLSLSLYEKALTEGHFTKMEAIFSKEHDKYRWICRAPGGKTKVFQSLPVLLSLPKKKKPKPQKRTPVERVVVTKELPPIQHYLLTPTQLCENDFPFLSTITNTTTQSQTNKFNDFIELEDSQKGQALVAIDCEMCMTKEGLELTRVSVIDEDENVLYDQFVKPLNPIVDYLTQYSGVSEADLADVTHTLQDVHNDIKKFITRNTVMVGHSLENDLLSLKLFHDKIIDTSILYPHEADGCKNALKNLAVKYLNLSIQESAHDSVQDAIVALRLFKLKLSKGPSYGIPEVSNENLFEILTKNNRKCAYVDKEHQCKKIWRYC